MDIITRELHMGFYFTIIIFIFADLTKKLLWWIICRAAWFLAHLSKKDLSPEESLQHNHYTQDINAPPVNTDTVVWVYAACWCARKPCFVWPSWKHSDFSVLEIIFKFYKVERPDDFLSASIFLAPSSRKLISDCIPVWIVVFPLRQNRNKLRCVINFQYIVQILVLLLVCITWHE